MNKVLFSIGAVVLMCMTAFVAFGEDAVASDTVEVASECVAPMVANVAAEGETLSEDAPLCVCPDGTEAEMDVDGNIVGCAEVEADTSADSADTDGSDADADTSDSDQDAAADAD